MSNLIGKNLDFFAETDLGRRELTKMCSSLVSLSQGMPENSLLNFLNEVLDQGINNELEAFKAYYLSLTLRVIRHESSHIAGGIVLGKKNAFKITKIIFREGEKQSREVKEFLDDYRFTYISRGQVQSNFKNSPKNISSMESAYSAIAIIVCPEFCEIPFNYNNNEISIKEGGMSEGDKKSLEKLKKFCKDEKIDYEEAYEKVIHDSEVRFGEILEETNRISNYLLPKVANGQRDFLSQDIRRILRKIQ